MASSDKISSIHDNIAAYAGSGSLLSIIGMSSYFMSHDYETIKDKVIMDEVVIKYNKDGTKNDTMSNLPKIIKIASLIFLLAGLTLILLSIVFYRNEREERASDVGSLLDQVKEEQAQPGINEPAILAGMSMALILAGAILSVRDFEKDQKFGIIASSVYALGWIGQAFAASMQNKSIDSISAHRLAWTLPGVSAIVAGTYLLPWQFHRKFSSGPAWSLIATGFMAFSIGDSYVLEARSV